MRIIEPHGLTLHATGTPTYIQAEWSSAGVTYATNARVRYAINGIYYDYRSRYYHTSSASRAPTNTSYWTYEGSAATSIGYTYTTNVQLSAYDTWTTGVAVAAGTVRFDASDRRDYQATIAVSSGDNTIRPSDAVKSGTESIAARWVVVGPANAWAPFDTEIYSRLRGFDANNALISPVTMTATCIPGNHVNCLMLVGLVNVKTVVVTVTYDGALQETLTANLTPANPHYGIMPSSHIFNLTTVIAAGKAITLGFTLTAYTTAYQVEVGIMALGYAYELAETEWGVESSILSFSRKQRDETFGTVSFLKRGSATKLSATCFLDPQVVNGDVVYLLLAKMDGYPVMMDFNNGPSNYDRLRIFGFYTNVRTVVKAATFESLVMDVESLVT